MSFLKNDSLFDVTGISLTDFTLSCESEPVLLPKSQGRDSGSTECDLSSSKSETAESHQVDSKENVPVKQPHYVQSKLGVKESIENSQLALRKLAVRHDIMDQTSAIISDLVAIDMKYSSLYEIPETNFEPRPLANSGNLALQADKTPLDTFHEFTICELHKQLSSVRNYIEDLDSKYSDVARNVQEKILNLEQANINLRAEVERLRKFY